jgi:hypothetical protein
MVAKPLTHPNLNLITGADAFHAACIPSSLKGVADGVVPRVPIKA